MQRYILSIETRPEPFAIVDNKPTQTEEILNL